MSENNKKPNGFKISGWLLPVLLIVLFLGLTFMGNLGVEDPTKITYSKFDELLQKGQIEKVVINNSGNAEATLTTAALKDKANSKVAKDMFNNENKGPHYTFQIPDAQNIDNKLAKAKQENKIKEFDYKTESDWANLLLNLLPIAIFIGIWVYMMRRMNGGGSGSGGGPQIFNIGRSKAKLFDEKTDVKITFKDVAGLEGAKEEVQEIVEFLKNPEKYTTLGGKIPKGALLVGPPGTGKTLLAKTMQRPKGNLPKPSTDGILIWNNRYLT